jgi:hypothetical protein
MTWWGWLIFAAYWIVAVWVWRTAAYVVAHDTYGRVSREDMAFGIVFGAFGAAVWPVTCSIYFACSHDSFLRAPKAERLRAREEHIEELERELGLRR